MANAGYSCLVRRSGTSTNVADEPLSILASGGSVGFRITSAARRVIDPEVDFHFKNGTATLAYTDIAALDYMNGEVTFRAAQAAGSVTSLSFSGNYLPITTASEWILDSRSFSLSDSVDLLATDVFTGTTAIATRKRLPGLKDFSLEVESLATDADLVVLQNALTNGTRLVTEVYFGSDAIPRFRGLCLVENIDRGSQVDALTVTNMTFKSAAVRNATANLVASYTYKAQPG